MKANKLLSILVMAMFILSVVPLALADAEGKGDISEVKTNVGISAVGDNTAGEGKNIDAKAAKDGIKSQLTEVKEEVKEKQKELKEEIKTAVKEIKENSREMLRERAEKAKENYESQKVKLGQANEKVKSCLGDKNSTDCLVKKSELKFGVKNHLENTLQLIESSMARVKEQTENSKVLSEEDKKTALADLAALEEKLNAQKVKVEALSETATNEELKAAIQDLKDLWKEVRQANQKLIVQLTNSKLDTMVEKHDEYYNAMKMRIDFLAKKGIDTANLGAIAEKFSSQVADLKEAQAEADLAWSSVKSSEGLDAAKEAQTKVREGMKATKETLKEFLKQFNELYKPVKGEAKEDGEDTTPVTERNASETVTIA